MFKELGKFWKNHPVLTLAFTASSIWIASENIRAARAGKDDYWGEGVYGIGSGPFARHQKMASMRVNPTGASTSTTTSSSSSHAMFRNHEDEPGTPSMPMPMMLHGIGSHCNGIAGSCNAVGHCHVCGKGSSISGIPSSVKRRVSHGGFQTESLPDEYGISGMHLGEVQSNAFDIMGLDGVMPEMTGESWV